MDWLWQNAEFRATVIAGIAALGAWFSAKAAREITKLRADNDALNRCLEAERKRTAKHTADSKKRGRRATDAKPASRETGDE